MRHLTKITAAALTVGALTLGLTACGSGSGDSAKDAADAPLVVAASPVPHAEILNYVKDHLAAQDGLTLQIREFTDYVTPNTAAQDGSVDVNYFQHKPYLDDFNKKNGTDLVPVPGGTVHLEPLGVYSQTLKDLSALPQGATVAVPNDPTNEARALALLADQGVLTLTKGAGFEATPKDIASNPKHIRFKELEAAQVPRSLADVDAAVINGNYALEAHLSPAEDALAVESPEHNPYDNILVVKKGNEGDPRVRKLAKLLASAQVKKYIADTYHGTVVPSA